MPDHQPDPLRTAEPALSRPLIATMALACGALVANIYFAQPLVGLIGPDIGLSEAAESLVVTLTQLGYALGLLLLVPLGDRLENRRLIVGTILLGVLALVVLAASTSGAAFLVAACAVGVTSTSVQMLVPMAAHMAPEHARGQVVGTVMSGLVLGILLARPAASVVADALGWRAVFLLAAAVNVGFGLVLWRQLPVRLPPPSGSYGALIGSLWPIFRDTPVLRRRALYQACLFGSFALFWTAVPLELAGQGFGLSQNGIALFALCGAAGAIVAPIAGRLADRGYTAAATVGAMVAVLAAFGIGWAGAHSVLALAVAAIILDAGVQMNQVVSQRAIYSLGAEMRSRLNGVYMALFFIGGAAGSAVVSPLRLHFGWTGISLLGAGAALLALGAYASAPKRER